jgi:erythritol kinase
MHMRATPQSDVFFNEAATGYVMVLPVPGMVAQIQSNMASTLNIDWLLKVAADLMSDMGHPVGPADLIAHLDGWIDAAQPGRILFHPYISEAGERGPFVNAAARAGFAGLASQHRFPDLVRAVVEGLGMAARDCYTAMGALPTEVRLSGGAARSAPLRRVLSSVLGASVRRSSREEAGAAGAAMMAAVAIGAYPHWDACIADWVSPLLGEAEPPDPALSRIYDQSFPAYRAVHQAMPPIWSCLKDIQELPRA